MALTGSHAPGATPLRPDDVAGLRLPQITTLGELNEAEAANIIAGQEWALAARSSRMPDMLSDDYVLRLHRQMYGEVWKWAGRYRRHDTNIGSPHPSIRPDLRQFFEDAREWLERGWFEAEEFAVRVHHRLVKVHPFANGNGRHARLFADIVLVRHFQRDRLPWGGRDLGNSDPRRGEYIAALQEADRNHHGPLLAFARSGR